MGILDKRSEFCDKTALSTSASSVSAILGDVIDLTNTSNRPGNGCGVYAVIEVQTSVTSGGSAKVKFSLASGSTADLATAKKVHFATDAIPVASLTAGTQVACVELPKGEYGRYLGLWQDVSVATLTAGKVNAYLTMDPPDWFANKANPGAM